MATTPSAPDPSPAEITPAPILVAERTGPATYTGRNERGATVAIGPEGNEGVFSPGELLAIAVAACIGMSADSRISSELGDDVDLAVGITRTKDGDYNRYSGFTAELVVDGSTLSPERLVRLVATATKAIDRHCTVSRTLKAGASVDVSINTSA